MSLDITNHVFRALETSALPSSAATVRKSSSQDKNEAPCAGVRTADASVPVVRYWTVKIEARGRAHYVHVVACDAWKASLVALKRNSAAISAQVVREIDREEFEHLTRVPA